MTSIGLEMGLAIVVGWWIGQWLDGVFATEPYLMLLFLGCGIAAAFKAVLRAGRQAKRKLAESEEVEAEQHITADSGQRAQLAPTPSGPTSSGPPSLEPTSLEIARANADETADATGDAPPEVANARRNSQTGAMRGDTSL